MLCIIQEYAAGLLMLRLVSGKTIEKMNLVDNVCLGPYSFLNTTLYFTRLRLFAVNSKVLVFKE